jgi:hypothetical protein
VLIATHGIGGSRDEPRARQDVDVLVQARYQRKAVEALRRAYPSLVIENVTAVTRFIDPRIGKSVIDLIKPTQAIYRMVFKNTIRVRATHEVPDLEMALVSKYAAMISPNQEYIDAGDFINMVTTNADEIDLAKLRRLGNPVYKGGGKEVQGFVEDVKAGRRLRL